MNICKTSRLNHQQIQDIHQLVQICRNHDQTHLSFPVEDGEYFFLLYDNEKLISSLGLFFPNPLSCECSAFTLPSKRKQHCFYQLFQLALETIESLEQEENLEIDLSFLVDDTCVVTKKVLNSLDAEFWYREFMMICLLSDDTFPSDGNIVSILETKQGEYCFLSDKKVIGTCNIQKSGAQACLYNFEITKSFRGKGFGMLSVQALLSYLQKQNITELYLQVSESNSAAVCIYKKNGFNISETLSYYLY